MQKQESPAGNVAFTSLNQLLKKITEQVTGLSVGDLIISTKWYYRQ
jgi:hypothetical protein